MNDPDVHNLSRRSGLIRLLAHLTAGIVLLVVLGACSRPIFLDKGSDGRHTISMTTDNTFDPATIVISAGDTVVWWNESNLPHTVTTDAGALDGETAIQIPEGASAWDSGEVLTGQFWSHTFTTPGTYIYVCRFHADVGMLGVIQVGE